MSQLDLFGARKKDEKAESKTVRENPPSPRESPAPASEKIVGTKKGGAERKADNEAASLRSLFKSHSDNKPPVRSVRKRPVPIVPDDDSNIQLPDEAPQEPAKKKEPETCVIQIKGADINEERLWAIKHFLMNNPGDIKVMFEIEVEMHGRPFACKVVLPDELAVSDARALELCVESAMAAPIAQGM